MTEASAANPRHTMEWSAFRRQKNRERREAQARKPKTKGAKRGSVASPGWGLQPLWKALRLRRLKARGGIKIPHTRQLWAEYRRRARPDRFAFI